MGSPRWLVLDDHEPLQRVVVTICGVGVDRSLGTNHTLRHCRNTGQCTDIARDGTHELHDPLRIVRDAIHTLNVSPTNFIEVGTHSQHRLLDGTLE
jgi:hypothetical protein